MARRRKSTGNAKTRDNKSKEKTSAETSNPENESESVTKSNISTTEALQEPNEKNMCETNSNDNSVGSQNIMMPIDIQQMILGDLQGGSRREEIVVSRESAGDTSEGDPELEVIENEVVESVREEEYDVQSEEEEGQQIIYINQDEGEEGQYVIVVNGDDFEVTGEEGQEEVTIHNISELTEGSCEIITVVRESDYESSQESGGEVDEECDNINAVIGDIDGMHCVKISQYQLDDESSNPEANLEREETTVVDCLEDKEHFQKLVVHQVASGACESLHIDDEKSQSETVEESVCVDSKDKEKSESETIAALGQVDSNSVDGEKSNLRQIEVDTQVVSNLINKTEEATLMEVDSPGTLIDNNKITENLIEMAECKNMTDNCLPVNPDPSKVESLEKTPGKKENVQQRSKRKHTIQEEPRVLRRGTRKGRTRGTHLPDSTEPSNVNLSENVHIKSESQPQDSNSAPTCRPLYDETDKDSIQEDKVTSNSSASENSCSNTSEETVSSKSKSTIINESIKKITCKSSASENLNSNIQLETDTKVDTNSCNSLNQDLPKVEHKYVCIKDEVMKVDEEKQNTGRSRSGSTDTTGSESGSTSSSSRRRSGRIKSISSLKQEAESLKSISSSVPVVSSTTTPPVLKYETDKPVKVKSRWRRSSELEMVSGVRRVQELEIMCANSKLTDVATPPARPSRPSTPPYTPPPDEQVEDVLSSFLQITFNEYLTDRSKSKEAKRMVCDCTLTKEEIARGDMGCGEDCLNRLLMIECGSRCMLGERCANKRFQNVENAKCEIFKTEKKGYGLKALEDLPPDTFLLEYVGEVLDPKEFRKRAKEYSKDKNLHFYFMALKSDSIIDATHRGNISRFINHSCEPNAETQKWTVNGELRIGFFSKCSISAGEEITFDYKFQRYGKEAQRCFCESSNCRGWIGEDPEKENKNIDASGRSKEKKDKKKKEDKKNVKDILDDMDLQEEIEKLVLKNRAQTLLLCRLMVRAEEPVSRSALLGTLQRGETACLRLFLDYHGLRLIWSWMMDPATNSALKVEILETLAKLPIPNKTMLQDSKVLSVVEKWSTSAQPVKEAKDRSSTEDDSDKGEADKDKQKAKEIEKNSDDSNSSKTNEIEDEQDVYKVKIVECANNLLKEWASLKEVFRIPKKERIEQMKEHEREADEVYRDGGSERPDKGYERSWSRSEYDRRDKDRDRKRGRDSPDSDRARKSSKVDDKQSHLTKLERRQLFAIKVAQEEEERLRRQHENQWQEQVQRAAQEMAAQEMAAQEAAANANHFNGFPGFPPPHQWMGFPPDGNMMPPPHLEGQPMFHNNPPPFLFNQSSHLPQHPPFLDPQPFPMYNQPPPLPKQPLLHTPPLPKQPYEPPLQNNPLSMIQPPLPNHPPPILNQLSPVVAVNVPFQNSLPVLNQFNQALGFSQPPLPKAPPASGTPVFQSPTPAQVQPPLPQVPATSLPQVVPAATIPVPATAAPLYLPVKLPPKWKTAKDAAGRTYYYHVKTRVSQWEPPIFQAQTMVQESVQQESESETDSSDSEDDSSSEEEEQEEEKPIDEETGEDMVIEDDLGVEELGEDSPYEPETMELLEDIEDEPKTTKHSSLVQERIISPRTADEIPDKLDKRKIRQLKEKLRREKSKEKLRQKLKKSKQKGRSGTSKCEADTSSDPARKIKDAFRLSMAGVIVHYLNYYRKPDAKIGKITNTEDFKHLARKLTHFVMLKELKHCRSVDDLQCNDNVKHKARDFIKKYMAKFGAVYQRREDVD